MSLEPMSDVPDLWLEQYRLGELTGPEKRRLDVLLVEDERLRARLAALELSDRDIAERYQATWLGDRARERLAAGTLSRHTPSRGHRRLVVVSTLAVVAVAITLALSVPTDLPPGGDRIKGLAPSLTVYRRTVEGSETLADGAPAREGDLLRLGYVSAGRQYGVILSIDGRGIVTRHLPPDGSRAAALRADGVVLLDAAYELDDAPAWERFYFVTSDRPFEVAAVEDAARRAAAHERRAPPDALPVSDELGQFTFTVKKEVRP